MSEFDPRTFRDALGQYATGVTIVTTVDASGKPAGMTVNSFASVSLDPPLLLWSIDRSSDLFTEFSKSDHFAVHVLRKDQQEISNLFATDSKEKFSAIGYENGISGLPLLAEYCARFQCSIENRFAGGDHLILVGRVLEIVQGPGEPLVFHAGQYREFKVETLVGADSK